MRRLMVAMLGAAISLSGFSSFAAEPVAPADAQAALRKELSDLMRQREELRRTLEADETLAAARKTRDEAAKAYMEAEKADAGLTAARQAQREAMAEYDRVLAAKVAASGAELVKQKDMLDEQRHGLMLQQAIIDVKLQSQHSPVQRALEANPALAELQKTYRAIDPQEKAARDAARQKYDDARAAAIAALPEAKALEEERSKLKAGLANLDKQQKELDVKLRAVRDEVRKAEPADLKAASAKVMAAQKAVEDARDSQKLKAARDAAQTTAKAVRDKVNELLVLDPKAKAVNEAMDAKSAQLQKLRKADGL